LAGEVGLSAYYFQRLFKKEMGESPLERLTRIRLDRATHLMVIDPALSMTNIAYDCGFSSLSAFSRSFSKRYGKSPIEYSRSIRQISIPSRGSSGSGELIIRDPDIVFFPGCWIIYSHTSVFRSNLLDTFHSLIAFCHLEEIPGRTGRMFGIFTHIHQAFHGPKDQLNYYAGVEVSQKPDPKHHHRLFWIPEGKYACFSTDSSYHDLFALKVKFKTEWIDKKSLRIRDIFAFEHISECNKSSDHPRLQRIVYTPVR
jgi:AraC-like DNA-binding protein/DNA gyrase inhibitor GyrI